MWPWVLQSLGPTLAFIHNTYCWDRIEARIYIQSTYQER